MSHLAKVSLILWRWKILKECKLFFWLQLKMPQVFYLPLAEKTFVSLGN